MYEIWYHNVEKLNLGNVKSAIVLNRIQYYDVIHDDCGFNTGEHEQTWTLAANIIFKPIVQKENNCHVFQLSLKFIHGDLI